MTIETVDVPLGRGGKYGTLHVSRAQLPEVSDDHIWVYGIRQILNDAIADKTDDDGNDLSHEDLVAKAQKRLDTLYSGELRVRRETAEPADPVEAVMHHEARAAITRMMKKTPEYAAAKGKDRVLQAITERAAKRGEVADWNTAIERYIAGTPGLRKAAERIVAERAKTADIEL